MELFDIDGVAQEDLFDIDIDAINTESSSEAKKVIDTIVDMFYDENFKKSHPQVQKRISLELETLRGLIKMRKADEEAHDALISAISENKSNASLYRAMADIQKTSIAITNKIHDTMDRLNNICKGYQLELPLQQINEEQDDTNTHMGSRSFIESMLMEHQKCSHEHGLKEEAS